SPARLPRRRVDGEQFLFAELQFEAVGPLGESAQQQPIDPLRLPGAGAVRPEKTLLMVAENGVGATLLEQAHNLVREAVFPDAVAKTDQLVDAADKGQRLREPSDIAVQVRDDADPQG